jgi:hypothetical protein
MRAWISDAYQRTRRTATEVGKVAWDVRKQAGKLVEEAYVDAEHTVDRPPRGDAEADDRTASVLRLPQAERGLARLPRRRVVERSFHCLARCRRLAGLTNG